MILRRRIAQATAAASGERASRERLESEIATLRRSLADADARREAEARRAAELEREVEARRRECEQALGRAQETERRLTETAVDLASLRRTLEWRDFEIGAIRRSLSWRLGAPWRALDRAQRRLRDAITVGGRVNPLFDADYYLAQLSRRAPRRIEPLRTLSALRRGRGARSQCDVLDLLVSGTLSRC